MRQIILIIALLLVGLVNFAPLAGLFFPERMETLYGITISTPDLELLMRHRALLFGLVGGLVLISAFRPRLQPAALVLASISMIGFIVLDGVIGGTNEAIAQVVRIDLWALAPLAVAIYLRCPLGRSVKAPTP